MMEQAYLKERLLYAPRKGVFYWVTPPATHPRLLGEEAGSRVVTNGKPYFAIQIDGKKYKRGRLAFLFMEGRWPTEMIDHINGDGLDDRWENLREATATENAWNHKGRAKSSDLPMGVRATASGKYAARIGYKGELITIGVFATAKGAATAYRQARERIYGEFA